jgi:undecaprenyl-diphosphatase
MPDYLNNKPLAGIVRAVCWALAVLTVLSRLLSGVHWLTDIIGGIIISAFFLTLFYAAYRKIDYLEHKRRQ